MIGRIDAVTEVQETGSVTGNVYRSPLIPTIDTNALSIDAASLGLLHTVGTSVAQGSYLNAATAQEPVAVLGAAAAQRLGIDRVFSGERIWARQHVVLRRRHLETRRAGPRHRLLGPRRLPRRRALPRLRRPPLHHLRARPDRPRRRRRQPARRHRQPARTRARSTSPNPRPLSSPKPTPKAPSTASSWASAPSPSWSARSGWPTS